MHFYIVDDDEAIRSILAEIIEDEDLGEMVGEAENGAQVDIPFLHVKKVDIVLIDLLMPMRDGIETIRQIGPLFPGKFIMISQVETKELIAEAYSLGIEYYVMKPINRFEVLTVIKKVIERIQLERSIANIHKSLSNVMNVGPRLQLLEKRSAQKEDKLTDSGRFLLSELGVIGENGCEDLLEILNFLHESEENEGYKADPPLLKDIFIFLAQTKLGSTVSHSRISREVKASQQRVRRIVYQSLNHLAALGVTDFANPAFQDYASKFFDFKVVRQRMMEIKNGSTPSTSGTRINTKRFIQVLYYEAKRLAFEDR
ncbi:response regulator [Bacillus freudenreichii]|nr:response regulator [Bacillus freudenreichii]